METISITVSPNRDRARFLQDRVSEIKDNTIILAIDTVGGQCDRLMLGRKGIISNANATIECWNEQQEEQEQFITGTTDLDVKNAISILDTDNFDLVEITNNTVVEEEYIIGRNFTIPSNYNDSKCGIKQIIVDLNEVEFDENGLYGVL